MEETRTSNSKNLLLIVGVLVVLFVVGYFVMRGKSTSSPVVSNSIVTPTSEAVASGPVKEFTVDGSNFVFDPKTITVNKGDNVKITFKDDDGRHNLVIDGYNLSTNIVGPGSEDSISFVADKAGSFEYYCSVSNHREQGMTGTLTVQ